MYYYYYYYSMVFQPSSTISGLLWGIKAAIRNDPSSTILELLQLVYVCKSSTTPGRTIISKVGLNNTGVKSSRFTTFEFIVAYFSCKASLRPLRELCFCLVDMSTE